MGKDRFISGAQVGGVRWPVEKERGARVAGLWKDVERRQLGLGGMAGAEGGIPVIMEGRDVVPSHLN
jgi:hypothetical protein